MLPLLLALSAPAEAADCKALTQPEFRSLVLDTQAAIDRADEASHRTFVVELRSRLPCAEFVPSQREWAELLVAWALLEFGDGGDWQTPLASALRIRPGVDRGVGGAHPISRFELPGEAAAPGSPVPAGVVLFVDGVPAELQPSAEGIHLVQKEEDGWYESLVLVDQAPDADWLVSPVERPVVWEWQGWAGVAAGASFVSQTPENVVSPAFVPDDQRTEMTPLVQLSFTGMRGGVGFFGEASIQTPALSRVSLRQAELAARLGREVSLDVGAGVSGGSVIEGVSGGGSQVGWAVREVALPYGLLAGSVSGERWDARLDIGGGPAVLRSGLVVGRTLGRAERPLRVGLDIDAQQGSFVQDGTGGGGASTLQLRGALGLSWKLGGA